MADAPTASDILKGSFLKFLWYVWLRVLFLPAPTRIQLDLARFLVGGGPRRFIQAFRGVGKTFITAAYIVWRLWNNPDLRVLIVSANEPFAIEIATFIRQIIDAEAGDDLWGHLRPRPGQRDSVLAFDVGPCKADKSPSVKACGITGGMTGSRADLILSDDAEAANNSDTEGKREKLRTRLAEYAALMKPGGEVVYLGTPQTEQSVYADLPDKGYEVRIWPARYPTAKKLANYGDHLAPLLRADLEANPGLMSSPASLTGGAPTDPARFTEDDLIKREAEYRTAGFLLQFMLDTSLSDAERFPLKTKNLIVTDVDRKVAPGRLVWSSSPDLAIKDVENVGFDGDRLYRPMNVSGDFQAFTGSVMHIDPSGTGRDQTAYCVTKFLNGYVFVRRWGGFVDGYGPATLTALAIIAKEEEVNLVVVEGNFGDGMFSRLLEPYLVARRPCAIEDVKVKGQKEVRIINSLEPLLAQHRLVMDTTVAREDLQKPRTTSGLYQLTHLSSARGCLKHDDMVDVLAFAAAHWTTYLNADADKAEEERIRKAEEAFEQRYMTQHGPKPASSHGQRGRGRPMARRSTRGR